MDTEVDDVLPLLWLTYLAEVLSDDSDDSSSEDDESLSSDSEDTNSLDNELESAVLNKRLASPTLKNDDAPPKKKQKHEETKKDVPGSSREVKKIEVADVMKAISSYKKETILWRRDAESTDADKELAWSRISAEVGLPANVCRVVVQRLVDQARSNKRTQYSEALAFLREDSKPITLQLQGSGATGASAEENAITIEHVKIERSYSPLPTVENSADGDGAASDPKVKLEPADNDDDDDWMLEPSSPSKDREGERLVEPKRRYDPLDLDRLRQFIYDSCERSRQFPTLDELLCADEYFGMSRLALRRLLAKAGFEVRRNRGRSLVVERSDVFAAKARFLRAFRADEKYLFVGCARFDMGPRKNKVVVFCAASPAVGPLQNTVGVLQAPASIGRVPRATYRTWFEATDFGAPGAIVASHEFYGELELSSSRVPSSKLSKCDVLERVRRSESYRGESLDGLTKRELLASAAASACAVGKFAALRSLFVVAPPRHAHFDPLQRVWSETRRRLASADASGSGDVRRAFDAACSSAPWSELVAEAMGAIEAARARHERLEALVDHFRLDSDEDESDSEEDC